MQAAIGSVSRARCFGPEALRPILVLIFIIFTVTARGQDGDTAPDGKRIPARELTQDLLRLHGQFRHAGSGEQAGLLADLVKTATQRSHALEGLMEQDPAEVLRLSIPAAVRGGFAADVRAWMEEEVVLEGELDVMYEDGYLESRLLFGLETENGRLSLHFAEEPPMHLQTGAYVRVHGVRLGTMLALASGSSSTSIEALTTVLPGTFGEQKTAVILVNFQDTPTEPFTRDYARDVVFNTTSGFDMENSQNKAWLAGDVFGWYTIPMSSAVCDIASIGNYARQAASAAGANLAAYSHLVYGFPYNACQWSGQATVGGNPSHAWINGDFRLRVVGHEMGHNFGLYHSHAGTYDYGDTLDIMGGSSGHFNAFQKERLGWLNYAAQPPITTVQASGDYFIDPYELSDSSPKALKILKSVDLTTGQKTWYYVEHRRGIGFDSSFAGNTNLMNGVAVHTGSEASGNSSYLLDMTPETATFADPALVVANSFSDTAAGIAITTLSTSSSGASVRVTVGPQACAPAAPSLTTSTASQWGTAGSTLRYILTLTNRDGMACGSTTYTIGKAAPSGWTVAVSPVSVTLAPGASATVTVDVSSPSNAASGLYDTTVTATSNAESSKSASAIITYGISTPTCVPGTPRLTATSSATQSGPAGLPLNFAFTLANGDGSACAATTYNITAGVPAGWSAVASPASLTLSPGASAPVTVKVTPAATATDGSHSVSVKASSSTDVSKTALASVTCNISTTLTESVVTDKITYSLSETVTINTTVKINGIPAEGASVALKITKPNGSTVSAIQTTGSSGTAVYKYKLARKDPTGLYTAGAVATAVSRTVQSSTTFTVGTTSNKQR